MAVPMFFVLFAFEKLRCNLHQAIIAYWCRTLDISQSIFFNTWRIIIKWNTNKIYFSYVKKKIKHKKSRSGHSLKDIKLIDLQI